MAFMFSHPGTRVSPFTSAPEKAHLPTDRGGALVSVPRVLSGKQIEICQQEIRLLDFVNRMFVHPEDSVTGEQLRTGPLMGP